MGVLRTALYCRLSKDDMAQGDSESIKTQKAMLTQYAREHNFLVVEVYVDDGWSGLNFDRPDFNRMLDDIEAGKIDVVITKDLSRLGRDHLKVGHFTEIYFPMKNIRYIAVNDCVDTANKNNDIAALKNVMKNKRCLGGGTTKGSFMNFQMDKLQVLLHTAFTRPDLQSGKTL